MRAKNGYKFYKYKSPVIGRALHRYFLTRTVRKNRYPSDEEMEEELECDAACPYCLAEAENVLLYRLRQAWSPDKQLQWYGE